MAAFGAHVKTSRATKMWRSFFLAIGLSVCILGLECLVVDNFVVTAQEGGLFSSGEVVRGGSRELTPPDWARWSLLSAGAVTMLYSFTIPQRVAGGKR